MRARARKCRIRERCTYTCTHTYTRPCELFPFSLSLFISMRPDSPMRFAMSMLHNRTGGVTLNLRTIPRQLPVPGAAPRGGERNTYQETAALSAGRERQSRSFTVESLNRNVSLRFAYPTILRGIGTVNSVGGGSVNFVYCPRDRPITNYK